MAVRSYRYTIDNWSKNYMITNSEFQPNRKFSNYVLILFVCALLPGCGASRAFVTLSDLDSRFEVLNEAGIEIVLTDYIVSDIEKYNDFFKSSAIIAFTLDLSHSMTNDATANLKKYAQDHLAKMTMDENIEELIGDTPHDELSVEQSVAIMRMEKERDKISHNEKKYFIFMGGQIGIGSLSLLRGIKEVPTLLRRGRSLLTDVRGDFSSNGYFKFWVVPNVSKGIKESIERLNKVRQDAPVLVEDMKVLYEAFKMLS